MMFGSVSESFANSSSFRGVCVSAGLVLLTAVPLHGATADENPDWMQRAAELGITSGSITLSYSLTDHCELDQLRVIESFPQRLFDAATVDGIVKSVIGPFDDWRSAVAREEGPDAGKTPLQVMLKRTFKWDTVAGHRFLECTFLKDGSLERAEYVRPGKTAADAATRERIGYRLSRLPPQKQTVSFGQE